MIGALKNYASGFLKNMALSVGNVIERLTLWKNIRSGGFTKSRVADAKFKLTEFKKQTEGEEKIKQVEELGGSTSNSKSLVNSAKNSQSSEEAKGFWSGLNLKAGLKNVLSISSALGLVKILQHITDKNRDEIKHYEQKAEEIDQTLEILAEELLGADRLNRLNVKIQSEDNKFNSISRMEFKEWIARYFIKIKNLSDEVQRLSELRRLSAEGFIQKQIGYKPDIKKENEKQNEVRGYLPRFVIDLLDYGYLPSYLGGNSENCKRLCEKVELLKEKIEILEAYYEVLYLQQRKQNSGALLITEVKELLKFANPQRASTKKILRYEYVADFHEAYSYYLNGQYEVAKQKFEKLIHSAVNSAIKSKESKDIVKSKEPKDFSEAHFLKHRKRVFDKLLEFCVRFGVTSSFRYLYELSNTEIDITAFLQDSEKLVDTDSGGEIKPEKQQAIELFTSKYFNATAVKILGEPNLYQDGLEISYAEYKGSKEDNPYLIRTVLYLALTNMYLLNESSINSENEVNNAIKIISIAMAYTTETDSLAHCAYGQILLKIAKKREDLLSVRSIFNRAIIIAPTAPKPYYELARTYYSQGEIFNAARLFKKAYELNTIFPSIYVVGGYAQSRYNELTTDLKLRDKEKLKKLEEVISLLEANLPYSDKNKYLILPLIKCYLLLAEIQKDNAYHLRIEEIIKNLDYTANGDGYGEENEAIVLTAANYKIGKISKVEALVEVKNNLDKSVYQADFNSFVTGKLVKPTIATKPLFWIELGRFYATVEENKKAQLCYKISKSLSMNEKENQLAEKLSVFSTTTTCFIMNKVIYDSKNLLLEEEELIFQAGQLCGVKAIDLLLDMGEDSKLAEAIIDSAKENGIKYTLNFVLGLDNRTDIAGEIYSENTQELEADYEFQAEDERTIATVAQRQDASNEVLQNIEKIESFIGTDELYQLKGWYQYSYAALSHNALTSTAKKVMQIMSNMFGDLEELLNFGALYEDVDIANEVTIAIVKIEHMFDFAASGTPYVGLPTRPPHFDPDPNGGGYGGGGSSGGAGNHSHIVDNDASDIGLLLSFSGHNATFSDH